MNSILVFSLVILNALTPAFEAITNCKFNYRGRGKYELQHYASYHTPVNFTATPGQCKFITFLYVPTNGRLTLKNGVNQVTLDTKPATSIPGAQILNPILLTGIYYNYTVNVDLPANQILEVTMSGLPHLTVL